MSTLTRAELGAFGERLAVCHLQQRGFVILDRNWRCRYGELDVVAVDPAGTAVFVEVKTRSGDGFGGLAYAVSPVKVRRLHRLAGLWLAGHPARFDAVRIDVIGVRVGPRRVPEISHLAGVG